MKSLISLCVLALFIEAVMSAPGGYLQNVLDTEDMENNDALGALENDFEMMRDRRGSKICLKECFACTRMVSRINPSQCVSGCTNKGTKGAASKTWSICSMALQRRK